MFKIDNQNNEQKTVRGNHLDFKTARKSRTWRHVSTDLNIIIYSEAEWTPHETPKQINEQNIKKNTQKLDIANMHILLTNCTFTMIYNFYLKQCNN